MRACPKSLSYRSQSKGALDWSHYGLGFPLFWLGTAWSWDPRDHGSRKPPHIVVQWELRPSGPHYSSSCLASLPACKSSHIPPGNRKPQLQPRLQTAPPSGQGVWEERPEARGQRSALFLPEVVRDPGETEGGQGRALDSHPVCVVCVNSCVYQGVHGSHCWSGGKCVSSVSLWLGDLSCASPAYISTCLLVCGCSAWAPSHHVLIRLVHRPAQSCVSPVSVTWYGFLCPRATSLFHLLPSHPVHQRVHSKK